jgi:hypothetical protein
MKLLSLQERDAINYFKGQGFYRFQQDYRTESNIFDTIEYFLIKMHDESNQKNHVLYLDLLVIS